jgi:hypothetical protein
MASEVSPENPIQRQCADCASEQQEQSGEERKDVEEMSVAASGIQTKLTVGAPGDVYEQVLLTLESRINAPDAKTVKRQSGSGNQLSNDSERLVYQLRHQISAAATSDVSAGLIAAILYDENQLRDVSDSLQDTEARFIILYEGWTENTEVKLWETVTRKLKYWGLSIIWV